MEERTLAHMDLWPTHTDAPMDRQSRGKHLTIATAVAALLLGGVCRRALRNEGAGPASRNGQAGIAAYPPRLLELPEGVVPVALHFAPPPLGNAPVNASQNFVRAQPPHAAAPAIATPERLPAVMTALPPVEAATSPAATPAPTLTTAPTPIPEFSVSRLPPPALVPESTSPSDVWMPSTSPAAPAASSAPVSSKSVGSQARASSAAPAAQDRTMNAIESRASAAVQQSFALAERGALFTARTEMLQALRTIAQALDAAEGGSAHSESLTAALRALEEGADFQPAGARPDETPNLATLVEAHRTPVLKNADLQNLTALEAMQRYYTYAQEQFAVAGDRRPAASHALYGLGKVHGLMAEQAAATAALDGPKSMVYHQAALLVDPKNFLAANELGVLLARYGQWEDAKQVLVHSVAVYPLPESWRNLATVHEHLGEADLAGRAKYELSQIQRKNPLAVASNGPRVRWLQPTEFAATGDAASPPVTAIARKPATAPAAPQTASDLQWWKPWSWF